LAQQSVEFPMSPKQTFDGAGTRRIQFELKKFIGHKRE
jgi:hypothetical protein